MMNDLNSVNAYLENENKKYRDHFQDVPKDSWEHLWKPENGAKQMRVMRNKDFLVQLFKEDGNLLRMTVNRTRLKEVGRWDDNITWDELQEIKSKIGLGEFDGVEVFPRDIDVVNVANMRHIWILIKDLLPFAWRTR